MMISEVLNKIREILKGKSKIGNLIVLGVFLILTGHSLTVLEHFGGSSPISVGFVLIVTGLLALWSGLMLYIFQAFAEVLHPL